MQLINPAFGFAPSTVKWRTMPMNSSSFRVWPIWTSLLVGEIIVIFRTCTLDTSGSEHLWTNAQNASVCMENSETNRIKKNCHVSGKQFRCDFPYFRRCSMYKISMSCGYLWQMIAKTQLPCALLDFWWYLMMAWRSTMSFGRSNSSIMHRGMAPPHGLQLSIFLSMRKVSTPSWIAGAIAVRLVAVTRSTLEIVVSPVFLAYQEQTSHHNSESLHVRLILHHDPEMYRIWSDPKSLTWQMISSPNVGHTIYRRKFRSQTSGNMDRWKSRGGKSQRREEERRSEKRRESVRGKKMQVCEKWEKSRLTAFFPMICGSG